MAVGFEQKHSSVREELALSANFCGPTSSLVGSAARDQHCFRAPRTIQNQFRTYVRKNP